MFQNFSERKLFIAARHGCCNGVRRALETVEKVWQQYGSQRPVCVYHEIVHNNAVIADFKRRGVQFVDDLQDVPDHAVLIWSAHGTAPGLKRLAAERHLQTVDAACPLVQKLHNLALERLAANDLVIFIGHANHPETRGVLGCGQIYCVGSSEDCAMLPDIESNRQAAVLTQTTWCQEDIDKILPILKARYENLQLISNICHATAERQQAVRELIKFHNIEMLLVIGSPSSSNSRRLCETAQKYNVSAVLIDDPQEIGTLTLPSACRMGITAGASVPGYLFDKALDILQKQFNFTVCEE